MDTFKLKPFPQLGQTKIYKKGPGLLFRGRIKMCRDLPFVALLAYSSLGYSFDHWQAVNMQCLFIQWILFHLSS